MSEGDGKERLVEWLRSGVCIRQAASHSGVEVDMRATVDLMAEAADTIASLTTQLETERERATKAEERCEAYKGQVEAGAKVIESLKADLREKAMWYLSLEGQATEALARAVKAEEDARNLRRLLSRYRKETPLGHQPHMIAAEVDAALKTGETSHD